MNTPICDFVDKYIKSDTTRLHMPGHKGKNFLGFENRDITEFSGADDLYNPTGIIAQSEKNASELFGCPTFYSTEGSSHCIRSMVYLAVIYAKSINKKPCIAALCNAHKTFLTAVIHLDVDVKWIYPKARNNYLSCGVSADELEEFLGNNQITALYITSPDYLGATENIQEIAKVCHRHNVLLMVDNAHGAYTRFLEKPQHPMDLGADICCGSAHKTLPVITGGAYLHIKPGFLTDYVKKALMLFGSTSPSYMILQSLDKANIYLESHKNRLAQYIPLVDNLKTALKEYGWELYGNEKLKLTICPKPFGYTGTELEVILEKNNFICEFSDADFLVIMLCPEIEAEKISLLKSVLTSIPRKPENTEKPPVFSPCKQVLSPRKAILSLSETVPVEAAKGRILASPCVACPPAVPIVMCGQEISKDAVNAFKYYGITHCDVIK